MAWRCYILGLLCAVAACGDGPEARPSRGAILLAEAKPSLFARKKVLIVGIDGLLPQAIPTANAPNLQYFSRVGRFSEHGAASAYTWSGPGWASILTGVWPAKHGVINNTFLGERLKRYPDIFSRLKAARPELKTARISSWVGLNDRIPTGADFVYRFDYTKDGDSLAVLTAKKLLDDSEPNLDVMFTYWALVDAAGHRTGFSIASKPYLDAVERADTELGEVLDALAARETFKSEDWLVVVTTDHGGTPDGKHGRDEPLHRTIFMMLVGASVARGPFDANPLQVDVLPTVLRHFDVTVEPEWDVDGQALQDHLPPD